MNVNCNNRCHINWLTIYITAVLQEYVSLYFHMEGQPLHAEIGRPVATIAELCFVAQWALLLREISRSTGSGISVMGFDPSEGAKLMAAC